MQLPLVSVGCGDGESRGRRAIIDREKGDEER